MVGIISRLGPGSHCGLGWCGLPVPVVVCQPLSDLMVWLCSVGGDNTKEGIAPTINSKRALLIRALSAILQRFLHVPYGHSKLQLNWEVECWGGTGYHITAWDDLLAIPACSRGLLSLLPLFDGMETYIEELSFEHILSFRCGDFSFASAMCGLCWKQDCGCWLS